MWHCIQTYPTAFDVSLHTHYVEKCSKFIVLDLSDIELWYAQTFILRSCGMWLRVVCRWILLRRNLLHSSSWERMRQRIPPRWRCQWTRLRGVITQLASRNHFTAMKTRSSKGINIHAGQNWRREDKEFKVGPTKRAAWLIDTDQNQTRPTGFCVQPRYASMYSRNPFEWFQK